MRILLSSSAALISTLLLINPAFSASDPEAAAAPPPPAASPAQGEAPNAAPGRQPVKAEDVVNEDSVRTVLNPEVTLPFIISEGKSMIVAVQLTGEVIKLVLDNNVSALVRSIVTGKGVAAEVLNSSLSKLVIDPPTIAHVKLLTDSEERDRFYARVKDLCSNPRFSPCFVTVDVNPPADQHETSPILPIQFEKDGSGAIIFLPEGVKRVSSERLAKVEKMKQALAALEALEKAKQEDIGDDLPKLVRHEELTKQIAAIEEAKAKFVSDNKAKLDTAAAKVEQLKKEVQAATDAVANAQKTFDTARAGTAKNNAKAALTAAQEALKAKQDALLAAEQEFSGLSVPVADLDARIDKLQKDIAGLGDVRETIYAVNSFDKKTEAAIKSQVLPLLLPK
ncbi:MAG: hypothetical protein LBE97_00170 [Holosporales bacterium]|jgi:predicted  nucleic acid-binding Zn-ribbon protein|nr:hypothetical protein [Holosporales bacterium]